MAGELHTDVADALRLGMIRPNDIAQRVNRPPDEVRAVLTEMERDGLVVLRGQDQGAPWWELTAEGHRRH